MTHAEIEAAAARLVERTCREQGLQMVVTDPGVLRRVATILSPRNGEGAPKGARTTCSPLTAATPPQRGGGLRAG